MKNFSGKTLFFLYISITAIVAVLPFFDVSLFSLQIVAFVLVNLVAVSGLVILYGFTDQISLAQGAFFGIGAYTYAITSTTFALPQLLGVAIAVAISAVFGFLIGFPVLRLKGHYLAMGTLAFSELFVWIFTEAKILTGGVDGFSQITPLAQDVRIAFVVLVVITSFSLLLTRNLASSTAGDSMRAVGMSEHGARSLKVNIEGIKLRAHIFSASTAGLAGALYAGFIGFISPEQFGASASIMFLAMAIIGGRYRLLGPAVSVIALTLIQYLPVLITIPSESVKNFISSAQTDIYALIIIAVTLLSALRGRR